MRSQNLTSGWAKSLELQKVKGEEESEQRFFLFSPSFLLFFFFFLGCWQKPSASQSAFNYRQRMMLALFLSIMSHTCKLQNILQSHHCLLIPPHLFTPSLPASIYSELSDSLLENSMTKDKGVTSILPTFKSGWFTGHWDFFKCIGRKINRP